MMINPLKHYLIVFCCAVGFSGVNAFGADFLIDKDTVEIVTQPELVAKFNVRLKELGAITKAEATVSGKSAPANLTPLGNGKTIVYFLLDVSDRKNEFAKAGQDIVQRMADRLSAPPAVIDIGLGTIGSRLTMLTDASADKNGRAQILNNISNGKAEPTAEIYRCTLDAIDKLKKSPAAEHKAIVLLTSGKSDDKDTVNSPDGLIAEANRQAISIFTVGFARGEGDTNQWQGLRRVARETGGAFIETTANNKHTPINGDPGLELLGMLKSSASVTIPLAGVPAGPQNLAVKLTVRDGSTLTVERKIEVPAAGALAASPSPGTPSPTANPGSPSPSPTASPVPTPIPTPGADKRPAWLWPAIIAGSVIILGLLIALVIKMMGKIDPVPPVPSEDPGWENPGDNGSWDTGSNSEPEPPVVDVDKGGTEPGTQLALGWLEEIDKGSARGIRHAITKSKIVLGRSSESDLRLLDGSVSLHHATIHRRSDREFVITDLRSANKVYVNGKPVEHSVLKDGDIIELGTLRLKLVFNPNGK